MTTTYSKLPEWLRNLSSNGEITEGTIDERAANGDESSEAELREEAATGWLHDYVESEEQFPTKGVGR